MRVNRLWTGAAATLAVASLFSIEAGGVARAQDACARVRSACLAAGFRQGAARSGRGVEVDCIDPILQHRRAPERAVLPLPRVNPQIVEACLNPAAARRAAAAQAAAARHASAPTNAALPTNAAAASTNAALPTNATAPANAVAPTNTAAPTNAALPTNAAAPTNATVPSAAAPASGWPWWILAALVALAAGGGAIFVARRRRPPATPRPMASAPPPDPTPPAEAAPTSRPPAPAPDAPPLVAAVPSPTAAAAAEAPVAAVAVGAAAAADAPLRTHDVFISYSSDDKPVADAVCAILEQQRIRCWMTPRDVRPGEEWAGAIVRAIRDTRVVVLIFSASSNASPQVLREVERAVHDGAIVIPFRIQDTPPSQSLEYFISTPHWLDALTAPLEQHVLRLADSVKSLLAQSPP